MRQVEKDYRVLQTGYLLLGRGVLGTPRLGSCVYRTSIASLTSHPLSIITAVFLDLGSMQGEDHVAAGKRLTDFAILTPRNDDVNVLNELMVNIFPWASTTAQTKCFLVRPLLCTRLSSSILCNPLACQATS